MGVRGGGGSTGGESGARQPEKKGRWGICCDTRKRGKRSAGETAQGGVGHGGQGAVNL